MSFPKHLTIGVVLVAFGALASCTPEPMVPEGCITGVLTADGDTCQTIKSDQSDKIYSFYADMNGYSLGEKVCVCGQIAQMTTCKTGRTIDVMHIDYGCPTPSSKSSQFTFPFD